jgi:AcrR family transcriptional regulator
MADRTPPRPARDRLLDATTALLDEREPAEITITEIAGRARVTRPTFYATFADLPTAYSEAAIARISAALPDEAVREGVGSDGRELLRAAIVRTVSAVEPHALFFRRVLLGHAGHRVQSRIIELLATEFGTRAPVAAALARGPLPVGTSSTAIAAAVSWTMLTWFAADDPEPAETLADTLTGLIHHSVIGGLGRQDH